MPDNISRFAVLNMYHVALFAYFLDKLRATPDGDGTLLDHSLVLYGSGMSDGNQHNHTDLPILLAGGASGRLKGGRHLRHPKNTPMANLLVGDARQARGHDGQARRQHRADQSVTGCGRMRGAVRWAMAPACEGIESGSRGTGADVRSAWTLRASQTRLASSSTTASAPAACQASSVRLRRNAVPTIRTMAAAMRKRP